MPEVIAEKWCECFFISAKVMGLILLGHFVKTFSKQTQNIEITGIKLYTE